MNDLSVYGQHMPEAVPVFRLGINSALPRDIELPEGFGLGILNHIIQWVVQLVLCSRTISSIFHDR